MSIQPINYSQPNNKPAFTGYVDKSVVKLLDRRVNKISERNIEVAKLFGGKADINSVCEAIKKRTQILDNLKKFMAPLHHDTALKYKPSEFGPSFFIQNKKLKSKFKFCHYSYNAGYIYNNWIDIKAPTEGTLYSFLTFIENLSKVDSKEVNRHTFKQYTDYITKKAKNISFFPKFRLKRLGKKADKIAKEFRQPEIWQDKLLVIHREAKELERQQRIKKKQLKKNIKQSKKIMKDLIKNNKNSQ